MLFLNKFLLYVNAGLLVSNLWLHQPGWAALAAAMMILNMTTIASIEAKK